MSHTKESLIAFESRVRAAWEAGELPTLLHLCGGNEDQLLNIFKEIQPGDWVFSTHRNHYHALLAGIPEEQVFAAIMEGRSMFMFSKAHNFFTSAILAGTCGIAAGVAYDIRATFTREHPEVIRARRSRTKFMSPPADEPREPRVWCFLGDGATEQGHFAEAVAFVAGHDLPCTFIIEDNDRQVDTRKADRRGPRAHDWAHQITWPGCVRTYHYVSTYPHAGSGCKFQITFKPEAIERLRASAA